MKAKLQQLTKEFLDDTSDGCPVCREEAWCSGEPLTTEDLLNHSELRAEPKLPPQLRGGGSDADESDGGDPKDGDSDWPTCTAGSGPRSYRPPSGRGLREAEALWVKKDLLAGFESATGDVSPHVDIEFSNENHTWEVRVYYALQWHAFRHWMCGGDLEFIRSIRHTRRLKPAGGKSGASFYVGHNGRYIFKALKAREQDFIKENGEALFWYDAKRIFQNMPTTLIELYGMFTVTHKQAGGRQYRRTFIVMRHLEHHLSASQKQDLLLFDLKGVGPKRAFREAATSSGVDGSVNSDEPGPSCEVSDLPHAPDVVLWDQNFHEWTRGLPLTLSADDYLYLQSAVSNDTYFLSKLYIVDYSLLLMIHRGPDNAGGGAFRCKRIYAPHECRATSEESSCLLACGPDLGPLQVSFGMIDYFRPYTWEKQLETLLKTAMSAGNSLANVRGVGPTNEAPVTTASAPEVASLLLPPMASSEAGLSDSGEAQSSGPVEIPLIRNASVDARKLMSKSGSRSTFA